MSSNRAILSIIMSMVHMMTVLMQISSSIHAFSTDNSARFAVLPTSPLHYTQQRQVFTDTRRTPTTLLASNEDGNDETNKLLEKARLLREQVSSLERTKLETQQMLQQEREKVQQQKEMLQLEEDKKKSAWKERYSVEVPILKDMGEEVMESIDFPPRFKGGKSRVIAIQAPLPLGLLLGEDASIPGITSVDEVSPDGNGAKAGVQQGDILRAITACQTTMETPTWQLIAGGIGQPKTKRFMYSVDGRPLEEVMDAIVSNRMDALGRDVWLVLE